jgi:hypothetical protein
VKTSLLICLSVLFSATWQGFAAAQEAPVVSNPIQVYEGFDKRVELRDKAGTCEVVTSSKAKVTQPAFYDTALPWPCWFHKNLEGTVRTHTQSGRTYILIESATRKSDRDCDTRLQSLQVSGKKLRLSENSDRIAGCPPEQWYTYMFTALFKSSKPSK